MAKVPNSIKKFKTLEDDLSTSIATALWQKAADLCEYINKSRPIGMVMWFNNNQDLLPGLPDPKYWKLCDGTAVNNPLSTLHGVVIPSVASRFVKHPSDFQSVFGVAGSDTRNFSHDHGGVSGYTNPRGAQNADNSDERAGPFNHRHTVHSSLGTVDIMPPYIELRAYIRIL